MLLERKISVRVVIVIREVVAIMSAQKFDTGPKVETRMVLLIVGNQPGYGQQCMPETLRQGQECDTHQKIH